MRTSGVLRSGALAAALILPAQAEDPHLVLSAGALCNQGNTVDLTQKTAGGYTFEVGALLSPPDFGPKVLVYGGYAHFPAAAGTDAQPTFELTATRLGVDLVYQPLDRLPLTVMAGPSFHLWKGNQRGGDPAPYPKDQHVKLGWRAGLGLDLSTHWAVSLHYTFTEWRSNAYLDIGPTNPSRPAYFSLMGSYRF